MPVINKHISIPKKVETKDDLDFHYLRKLGIQYIEELGGSLWTDYNSHDPGITILEMLCYAITDLGMRVEMPIQNLLAGELPDSSISKQFYKASEVLPSKPVTQLDYRKLFIDIDGVRNCWLRKYDKTVYINCKEDLLSYDPKDFIDIEEVFKSEYKIKGLYKLLVDFEIEEGLSKIQKSEQIKNISKVIREQYHANRNLCEDLIEIDEVKEQCISVCAQIEVFPEVDEEWVHANVLHQINKYLSTNIRFYSIKEMLDKGYSSAEIFEGPILESGFIDEKELKQAELRKEVRLSDIMKIIMNVEGVKLIKDITINHCKSDEKLENQWVICVQKDKKPILCDKSTFSYFKGVLPLNKNEKRIEEYINQLKEEELENSKVAKKDKDFEAQEEVFISPSDYTTIMNDFPETYGIGENGLSGRVTEERSAKAKQLKGYLLFFDQILASYFKHLGSIRDIFSISVATKQTYFSQAVKDIKGFEDLVKEYPTSDSEKLTQHLFEKLDNDIERRNQILDHLLSRFAERFGDYAFLMKAIYGTASDEIVLQNKIDFTKDYIPISRDRGSAFNYYKQKKQKLWNTDNISGVQKRISRLLGIKNYNRRTLSKSFIEVYPYTNSKSKTVFRWRIKNKEDKTVLSATDDYENISSANKELYFTLQQVIQTKESDIEAISLKEFDKEIEVGNIEIHKSKSGKFSFDIINPLKKGHPTDFIIAKQFKYYDSLHEAKEAVLDLIKFLKFNFSEEGIFLVEHLLLRPNVTLKKPLEDFLPICTNGCEDNCNNDPYSYKVSIVIPGYTYRFSNPDFRNYMEQVIKEELPAHIVAKICWVGYRQDDLYNLREEKLQQLEDQKNEVLIKIEKEIKKLKESNLSEEQKEKELLIWVKEKQKAIRIHKKEKEGLIKRIANRENDLVNFEKAYKEYLFAKTILNQEQPVNELKELIKALEQLNTIYPVGRLLDCSDESDALDGKIILGQTNIGTL